MTRRFQAAPKGRFSFLDDEMALSYVPGIAEPLAGNGFHSAVAAPGKGVEWPEPVIAGNAVRAGV